MKLPDDFRDALVCLSDAGADFMVVGGYAVAFHGHVRATKDIDVFVKASAENAERVVRAMNDFGAPLSALGISAADFSAQGKVVQFGLPPLRIDLLTALSGIDFDTARKSSSVIDVDGRRVPIIGLDALVKNKRAAARPQDLVDVTTLLALHDTGS